VLVRDDAQRHGRRIPGTAGGGWAEFLDTRSDGTKHMNLGVRIGLAAVTLAGSTAALAADDDPARFFEQRVKVILVERCLACHGADRKGGLDLRQKDTALQGGDSGTALEPGQPDASLLIEYVESQEMPPDQPLSADESLVLRQWVEQGAYYPPVPLNPIAVSTSRRAGYDWWSLRPLADPAPPDVASTPDGGVPAAWTEHPIDRFVVAGLTAAGLRPSPPADRRTLVRRATYDLTGLPPTADEVDQFVGDARPDAYERLIDRLLASPHYGEHWGRHWLDVVRFGESNGYERNVVIDNAWPFRDYVIRSLNQDKPLDQLIREHLAGDVLGPGDPEAEVGTAFLVCGPYDDVGNQDAVQAAQIRADAIDDMVRATGEAFLGLTIGCARCHDHKFDPVTQRDYYSWYATFAGVHHGSRDVARPDERRARDERTAPLLARKATLAGQRDTLEQAIVARGEAQAAAWEARWTRPPAARRGTEETFAPVAARYVRLVADGVDTNPAARTGYRIDEFEVWSAEDVPRNVALAHGGAEAIGRNPVAEDFADAYSPSLTIDGEFGATWIAASPELTIVLPEPTTINRVVFSSDRQGAGGALAEAAFVCEYRIEVSPDNRQWTEVATGADRQPVHAAHRRQRLLAAAGTQEERQELARLQAELAATDRTLAEIPPLPRWWVGDMRPAGGPFHVFLGGSPQRPGDSVVAQSLGALGEYVPAYTLAPDAAEADRRRALADWLTHPDNPLTPRVLANRVWHYHFGRGIVDTPSDFGFMGGRPTHPALLDWLARQLQTARWQLKPLHKQIMLSQAYQQSSRYDPAAAGIDADSRWLWRFPPRRLAAEEIRDTFLSLSGKLAPDNGGPGFRLYRYLQDNVATYVPLDTHGPDTYRRAVYHQNARATRIDLLTDFDAPDCAFAAPRRDATTTPLQALTLLNHRFTLDMAQAWAARLEQDVARATPSHGRDNGADVAGPQVERAFRQAFHRLPSAAERAAAAALVTQHGLPALCRALLNSNELVFVD
jgi:hypothetical protein